MSLSDSSGSLTRTETPNYRVFSQHCLGAPQALCQRAAPTVEIGMFQHEDESEGRPYLFLGVFVSLHILV